MTHEENKMRWWRNGLLVCLAICLVGSVLCLNAGSASAASKERIKIGIIGPMKLSQGKHFWGAAQIADEEIKAAGGVNVGGVKYEVEFVKADDNSQTSIHDAVSAMERLITVDKVNFVIGGWRSEAVLAMQEVMADNRTIFMATSSAHPEICARVGKDYDKYKYFFRPSAAAAVTFLAPIVGRLVEVVVRQTRSELGIAEPKVAIMMDKALYANPMAKDVEAIAPKIGAKIAGVWRNATGATDVKSELTAIKASGAHVIALSLASHAGVAFSKQWGELKIPAAPVGIHMTADLDTHWKSTHKFCNYVAFASNFVRAPLSPRTIPYYDKFQARLGERANIWSAGIYDSIFVLMNAIERAGTLDSNALVTALEKTDYKGAAGRIVFNPPGHKFPHDAIEGPGKLHWFGMQWRDGKQLLFWPDGKSVLGDDRWKGVKYEGTVDYQLPPAMVEYWKNKSK